MQKVYSWGLCCQFSNSVVSKKLVWENILLLKLLLFINRSELKILENCYEEEKIIHRNFLSKLIKFEKIISLLRRRLQIQFYIDIVIFLKISNQNITYKSIHGNKIL